MFAVQKNLAPVRPLEPIDAAKQGRFSGAARAQYAHGLAPHHAQVDFGEHLMVTEALADAADLHGRD